MSEILSALRGLTDQGALLGPVIFVVVGGVALFFWTSVQKRRLQPALSHSSYEPVNRGGDIHDYFNADLFLADPANVRFTAAWLESRVRTLQRRPGTRVDRLAFIEKADGPVGAITLKDLTSYLTGVPSITFRSRMEIHSQPFMFAAPPIQGVGGRIVRNRERIAVISDVATSGTTIDEAVSALRGAGAEVATVMVMFDREEGAAAYLRERGITLISQMRSSDVDITLAAGSANAA